MVLLPGRSTATTDQSEGLVKVLQGLVAGERNPALHRKPGEDVVCPTQSLDPTQPRPWPKTLKALSLPGVSRPGRKPPAPSERSVS